MSYLVVLIVDDPEHVPEVLQAWETAGALGITILESTGVGHLRRAGLQEDFPLLPSLRDLISGGETHHRTLFSVVDSEELVDRLEAAARQVIGDLNEPHTGFLFVVPVLRSFGMGKHRTDRSLE
jgi:hypothetical protein